MLVGIIDYDLIIYYGKLPRHFTPKIEVMLCAGYHKARGDIVHLITDDRDLRPYQKVYLWRDYMKHDKFDKFNFFSEKKDKIEFHGKYFYNQLFTPMEEWLFNATPDPTIYNYYARQYMKTNVRNKRCLLHTDYCSLRKKEFGYGEKKRLEFYDYDLGSQEDLDSILKILEERKEKGIFSRPTKFSKNIRCTSFETAVKWAQQPDFAYHEENPTNIYYLDVIDLPQIKSIPDSSLYNQIYVYLTNKTRFKTQEEFDEEFIKCLDKVSYCLAHKLKIVFTLPPAMKIDEENRPFRQLIFWDRMRIRDSLMNISKVGPRYWLLDFLKRHPEQGKKITLIPSEILKLGDVW